MSATRDIRSSAMPSERSIVWIIEDDELFGRQLSELVNLSADFDCRQIFRACEPAIALLEETSPPDLILMDIGLPGLNGIEGVRRIKRITPAVDIVMLTVFEDTENIVGAIAAGASGYLLKGSSLEVCIDALRSIIAGGAPVNPQIAKKLLDLFSRSTAPQTEYGLTAREKDVLRHLVDGLSKKQIADRLFVTFHTIDKHLRNIYAKLEVQSRTGAVAKVLREHLL